MSRLPILIYAVIALSSYLFGALYLFSPTFMPYHAVAVGEEWSAVAEGYQVLIGALLDVAGSGWLALAVSLTALIAVPIRRGERWARYAAPMIILAFNIPTGWATITVLTQSPASPPWYGPVGTCAAALLALLIDRPWRKSVMEPTN